MQFEATADGIKVRTPAKINLYLEIGPRRADEFHDIDSLFQAVSLYDELEFTSAPGGAIRLVEDGIDAGESNLVWRAADLLRRSGLCSSATAPGVTIQLRKRIPQGAGLGGGSSDAAATLLALARLWGVSATIEVLLPLAAELGSDVPFFLTGGTARCRGRGELVESLANHLGAPRPLAFVLVYPGLSVATKDVYEELDRSRDSNFTLTKKSPIDNMPDASVRCGSQRGDVSLHRELYLRELLFNRFEDVVYSLFPRLKELSVRLQAEAFQKVLLSGSGSTIYGVCQDGTQADLLEEKLSAELEADVFAVESVAAWRPASL